MFGKVFSTFAVGCAVVAALVLVPVAANAAVSLSGADVAAYWPFDSSTNLLKDSSANGNDLHKADAGSNDPVYDASGKFGGALDLGLAGDAGPGCPLTTTGFPNAVPTGDSSFTIAFWEKERPQSPYTDPGPSQTATWAGAIGWGRAFDKANMCVAARFPGGDGLQFVIWTNDVWNQYPWPAPLPPNMRTGDGTWHHIALTFDNTSHSAKIFVDGTQAGSGTPGTLDLKPENFYLGQVPWGGDRFGGWLDDMLIVKRALTQDEITALQSGVSIVAPKTWTGNAGTPGNWSVDGNWTTTAPVTGDAVIFTGNNTTNHNNLTANIQLAGLKFDTGAGSFTLSGNAINLIGDVTDDHPTNPQTIDLPLVLDGAGRKFSVAGGGTLTVSKPISETIGNSFGLTKDGDGTLVLTDAHAYTGPTTINKGTLQVGDGTHDGTLSSSRIVTNAALVFNTKGTPDLYAGPISGTGSVTKTGPGTLVLTGAVSNGGGVTVNQGTLQIGNGTTNGSIGSVTNKANVVFNTNADGQAYSSVISSPPGSTGNFGKAGPGMLALQRVQSYSGTTTINGGTLQLNALAPQAGLVHRWSFNDGTGNDSVGSSNGVLVGAPSIADGRLALSGGNYMRATLGGTLGESKTIMAWCSLASLASTSGGPISVATSDGGIFDAIDYGERVDRQWCSGSNFFDRTPPDNGGVAETLTDPDPIMLAITYDPSDSSNHIKIYRNGVLYAQHNQGTLATFGATAQVLFGPRDGDGNNVWGSLNGYIDEARIYNAALSAQDIADYYTAGPNGGFSPASNVLPATTALSITASGAALDLNGANQEIAALSGVAGSEVKLGGATLTVSGDTSPADPFAGSITGAGKLLKKGEGTLTLSGANTYDGGTEVEKGTLVLAKADALPPGSSLTIDAGGTVVLASGLSAAGGAGAAASNAAAVPEPGTVVLLAAGALALAVGAWRRRK